MAAKRSAKARCAYDPDAVRFINPAQVGGIETSTLADGPGRGVRIAWVNTGSPLRYKVLIDRGLDIAEAFYSSLSLAFLSLTGPTPPSRALDRGLEWLRGFYGGLLCSCGPQHVGTRPRLTASSTASTGRTPTRRRRSRRSASPTRPPG